MYIKRICFPKKKEIKIGIIGAWSDKVQISEPTEALPPTQDIPWLWWQERGSPPGSSARSAWVHAAPGLYGQGLASNLSEAERYF